ncbi:MAG: hypothetical protein ABJB66_03395 [Gemmatimonadaceae bacterium]
MSFQPASFKRFSGHSAVRVFALVGALSCMSVAASAQPAGQKRAKTDSIPAEYLPPAGMCRVWLDGVPATQQPAPTDCPSATLKKPANGRVVYGEDPVKGKGARPEPKLPLKRLVTPPVLPKKSAVDAAIPSQQVMNFPKPREPWENKRITDEQLFGDRPAYSPASSYAGTAFPAGQVAQGAPPNGVVGNTGILGDPRYFNNNTGVRPPGYGSTTCLDRDGDGWCDDLRFGAPVCLDQDKDGRCDDLPEYASMAYPQTLPHMRSALDVVQGRGSVEVARWLGTNEFTVRIPDAGTGSVPWRAIFLDSKNELLQVWTDRNRDGLAERVEIFRNGQRVKLIQR